MVEEDKVSANITYLFIMKGDRVTLLNKWFDITNWSKIVRALCFLLFKIISSYVKNFWRISFKHTLNFLSGLSWFFPSKNEMVIIRTCTESYTMFTHLIFSYPGSKICLNSIKFCRFQNKIWTISCYHYFKPLLN